MADDTPGTELPVIAECRLDLPGLRAQQERYQRLGEHVTGVDRAARSFTVRFDDGIDLDLMEETVAVERACCPFFDLSFEACERALTVSVEDPRQEPALDGLLFALGRADRYAAARAVQPAT